MPSKWYLGVIGGASLAAVAYILLQALLFERTDLYVSMGTLFIALLMGLTLKLMVYGKPAGVYTILSTHLLWDTILLVLGGYLLIRLAAAAFSVTLSVFDSLLLAGMAAVCETWAITGIQDVADYYTGISVVGIVFGAGIACLLHLMVYGASVFALGYVFVAFLVLNTSYTLSQHRVEVPMLIHLLINLLPFILMGVI